MKVDRVLVNTPSSGTATWAAVDFQQPFGTVPLVFALPTNAGNQPATLRLRNVTTTGFEIGVNEPDGADGQTAAMTVDYFAAEPGTYTFAGATRVIVGSYSTTRRQGRNVSGNSWDSINFSPTFPTAPAVIAQVQTTNSQATLNAGVIASPFLDVAIRNVSNTSVDMALERAETSTGVLVAETIGYLAMASGDEVTLSGVTIKAQLSPDNINGWDNGCYSVSYSSAFASPPLVVASQNSRDGSNGGWVRRCSLSSSSVGLTVDEDQSSDSDRSHTTERAGVLAISAPFHGARNGRDMEANSVIISGTGSQTGWTSVAFPNAFSATPSIFALATDEGSPPAALRLRNISINGFDIAAFEPSGSPGQHPQMTVDYVAIIAGEHTLPNGDVFEVGSVSTNLFAAGLGASTGFVTIPFSAGYSVTPPALLDIQTNNNEALLDPNQISSPWMTTAVVFKNASFMRATLERSEAISGSISASEQIAYFVIDDGSNNQLIATDGNPVDYEMLLTANNIRGHDDGCFNTNFADSYATPYAVASQNTREGANGGWLRRCNLEANRIGLYVDEDQANDSERSHTRETAGVFVFSRAFEAEFNTIDHYSVFHSGSGVTCEAESVIIGAHSAADLGTEAGGRTITISATSTTPGWSPNDANWSLASGTGTLTPISPGVAEYLFDTGESSADLRLANITAADIDIDVVDNADPTLTDRDGVFEDPLLTFSESGFRFYNDADGDGNADGLDAISSPLIAGTSSNQLILKAVQTDLLTGACQARLLGPNTVEMAYECVNPLSCVRSQDALINTTPIDENNFASVANFQTVNLNFDADGEAPFTLTYFDAGNIRLHAQLDLPAAGGEPAFTLLGTSDSSTVKPAGLTITAITDGAGNANPATTTTGAGFTAADTPFRAVVEARSSSGGITPNFGNEISPEQIALQALTLITPSAGDLPALIAANSFSAIAPGVFENTLLRWPEVGSLAVRAEIFDGDYLGAGNVASAVDTTVGRFYPDHFVLSSASITEGCGSGGFTYMSDQLNIYSPVDITYSLGAVSAGLVELQNYDGDYPVADFVYVAENNNSGSNLASRMNLPTGVWLDGVHFISALDNGGFRRDLVGSAEQPDGPFSGVQVGIRLNSASLDPTNFLSATLNMNAASTGDCSVATNCNALTLGAPLDVRFGRLYIQNAHGPETAELAVKFESQNWNPVDLFQINTDDNCTNIPMSEMQFDGNSLVVDANRSVVVGAGASTGSFGLFTPGVNLTFVNGDAFLRFSPSGIGNTGEFNVDVDLNNLPWLHSDWNGNGDAADDFILPSAEINFGRYRGHDSIIYWREVFQ
ncbi:MAG: hypothetical protein ACI9Y1_000848 [Lentisphaeria bacterium]|jgi:hypothetical protein